MMLVSEIGEIWSADSTSQDVALPESSVMVGSGFSSKHIDHDGRKNSKVPQLVPEAAIKIAMQKMTKRHKFIRLEFRLMAERTKVPCRASVMPFRVGQH